MKILTLLLCFIFIGACAEKKVATEKVELKQLATQLVPQATAPGEVEKDVVEKNGLRGTYRVAKTLRMSGSGTLNPAGLRFISKDFRKKKNSFYVVDLRQESHGLVNDTPMTWSSERDWATAGLTHDESIHRERRQLWDLKIGERLGSEVIKSFETEESLVRTAGFHYVRLTVLDHVRPADAEVDRFLGMISGLQEGAWVHFHCRTGKGRTTAFMMMYDILLHANQDSYADILARNKALSEDFDFLLPTSPEDWRAPYVQEYQKFMEDFYKYAQKNPKGNGPSWSEWIRKS